MTLRYLTVLLALLAFGPAGCGGNGTDGNVGNGGNGTDPADLEFNELMSSLNTRHSTLTSQLNSYIEKEQTLQTTLNTAGSSNDAIESAADDFISAAETFQSTFTTYDDFVENYSERLTSSSSSLSGFKSQGTADPVLAAQLGSQIADCKAKTAECNALTDETDKAICLNELKVKCPSALFRMAQAALLGAGATAITGLAIAAAPVTISVTAAAGISLAVGAGVGLLYDFCTSGSSNLTTANQSSFTGTCAMDSRSVSLSSGNTAAASVFQGTGGTLRIHIPGCAPIIMENVTIGASGLHLNVQCVSDESTESEAADANSDSSSSSGAQDPGDGTCSTVSSLSVTPSPTDPSPLQTVTVTATVFPVASGCTINRSVSGTDGYSASSSPTTDSSGAIAFTIPGGASGVVDTVIVTAVDSGASSTITYTF